MSSLSPEQVKRVRDLYKKEEPARALFDWAAKRSKDAAATTLERIISVTGISQRQAIDLARRLDGINCAEFVVGRRSKPSRIRWTYGLRGLASVAKGGSQKLEVIDPELLDENEPDEGVPRASPAVAEAIRRLAETLGVSPGALEIVIRPHGVG